MPVYAGPIQVDAIAPGRGPRIERHVPSPQPALASEGRLTRFLRSLWSEEPDEIELRARRAAQRAREQA